MTVHVVVPTSGRASLARLLERLEGFPGRVIVVEDGHRRGPAWARNRGWRQSEADWIVFLDDDVLPHEDWTERLREDLDRLPHDVAASQGRIRVPLPDDRRPTDWERNVAGLERARWATADLAVRRSALVALGGFDERFPRAFREDSDLGLRLVKAGYRIEWGSRTSNHPVRPSPLLHAVRLQAGNADDALMRALHGRDWRERTGAPPGRRPWHLATTAVGAAALLLRSRTLGLAWAALTAEFALRRILPGPPRPGEVGRLLVTSILIPPAASGWWIAGTLRARRLARRRAPGAVLLDRDGTLVYDFPYNGEPGRVVPVADARAALERLRRVGVPTAVVSNQSGIGRSLVSAEQVEAVNARIEELLGQLGPWLVCPHAPEDLCGCRKPAPGLITQAAARLGVRPADCVVIGDIGADVEAARAAGARAVLVPNDRTKPEEIAAAPTVARTLGEAVDLILGGRV